MPRLQLSFRFSPNVSGVKSYSLELRELNVGIQLPFVSSEKSLKPFWSTCLGPDDVSDTKRGMAIM